MRIALQRLTIGALLAAGLWGQIQPRPESQKEEKQDLAPATSPTSEEAADKAKTPIVLPALPTSLPVNPNTYVIGPEDILGIRVWREPELSTGAQVRPDGKITLPLVGEVHAAGLTPEQLKSKVVELLGEHIVKPEVQVSLQSVQSKKYHITGEVNRPGIFALVVPITVLEAMSNAGGFKDFANTKKITILRKGKVLKFNFNDVSRGKNMDQNIMVEPGDYIRVP